ncbi:MAG TPA: hypothetical protein VD866_04360 [Urbifossiella sp.]|nr:hypothetical protein [Urbifossiella sp.]
MPRGSVRLRLHAEALEDRVTPAAGALDPTFSADGRFAVDVGPNPGTLTSFATALQPDGKLVTVGNHSGTGGGGLVMRLNADGTVDPTFSNGALDTVWDGGDGMHVRAGADPLFDVVLQSDGKIVAVGGQNALRLTADGQPDPTFGTNGLVTFPAIGTGASGSFGATGLARQPDGKFVVSGYANFTGTGNDFVAIRLNADGTPDPTFDGDGVRSVAFSAVNGVDQAHAVAVQADGKIVLAGLATPGTTATDFAAVRLNADGSLDTTFSADGVITVPVLAGFAGDSASAVVIQPDGKIVLAGAANPAGSFQIDLFTAVRLNADGTLDTDFDGDGVRIVPGTGDSAAPGVEDAALLDDGRIVLVGAAPGAVQAGQTYYDFTVVVLTPEGANDTTFSADGVLIFEPNPNQGAGNNLRATGVNVTPAGQLLVSGNSHSLASFARLNPDGTFDTTYGTDGIANHQFRVLGSDAGNAAALQPDGKVVIAGNTSFSFADNADFALARVNPDGTLDTTFGNNGVLTTNILGADTARAVAVQPDGKSSRPGPRTTGPGARPVLSCGTTRTGHSTPRSGPAGF